MAYTESQFNKLPVWARSVILKLEADAKGLQDRVRVIEGECDSSVSLELGFKDVRPIPNVSRVKFTLANGERITVGFAGVARDRRYVSIRKETGSTYDLMCVVPQVSNEVYVTILEEPTEVK